MTTKYCPGCKETKETSEFWKKSKKADGLQERCKVCCHKQFITWTKKNPQFYRAYQRDTQLKLKYHLSSEQFDQMVIDQGGVCAICQKPPIPNKKNLGRLSVDHDHSCCPGTKTCGQCVRFLLCDLCNKGLGAFRDDPNLLLRAGLLMKNPKLLHHSEFEEGLDVVNDYLKEVAEIIPLNP